MRLICNYWFAIGMPCLRVGPEQIHNAIAVTLDVGRMHGDTARGATLHRPIYSGAIPLTATDIKSAGLRVTLPRLKVLEILQNATPHHLSAEEIYQALLDTEDSVGLATVYRVLSQFESAGIVVQHNFAEGHAVYELTPDDHHDHMVDVDTGQVIEFVNERIEKLQRQIAEAHGFDLVDHQLVLYVRKREA